MIHDGSNDRQTNSLFSLQSAVDIHRTTHDHNLWFNRKEDGNYDSTSDNNGLSVKWTSFQMKIMNCNTRPADNKTNNSIRVCSDCNTTTTPLWRSGPRGPKSLCNACGIRQRKARRAMEVAAAAANGAAIATDASSMKITVHNKKEKKSRKSLVAQYKKHLFKVPSDYNSPHHQSQKKLCFKGFALSLSKNSALQRVFPQDVEDAAILLMELSGGLVHS